ncbi:MAG: hypothetical protein IPI46_09975 [Bacteroidetes bacterium]|nr:hypothetical protein [Bacteroidota bacterium]
MLFTKKQIHEGIVLIVVLCATINSSFGQSYTHSPNDTIIANANLDFYSVFNITQLHPTNDTLYFKWNKISASVPSTWEVSICDNGHCNTSLVDSGAMDPVYIGDIGLMSLHLNPHFESGTAIIQYSIYTTISPLQVDTLTWIITATGSTSIPNFDYLQPTISINNQTLYLNNIDKQFTSLYINDLNGNIIYQTTIGGNKEQHYIPYINSPFVIVKLIGNKIPHQQKITILTQ